MDAAIAAFSELASPSMGMYATWSHSMADVWDPDANDLYRYPTPTA